VGFGNGYLETLIMKKGKCYIEEIDISEDMVKKAMSINRKYLETGKMKFRLGDCCSMDYKDGSFDVVTTMNTIYFWENTRKGMSEIYRVLKSGGVFYNAVITKEKLDSIFYTKSGFKKFKNEEYIEMGRDAGFANVEIKPLGQGYGMLVICRK
jgi:ubiquinone/menaquinone biosynthesis C-methylase UbiE